MAKKSKKEKYVLFVALIAVATVLISFFLLKLSSQEIQYYWTEIGINNQLIARAITTSDNCPKITIDENDSQMYKRAGKSEDSKVTTCEIEIPENSRLVTLNKSPLKLASNSPKKILVIGDTGCRLKGDNVQKCDDLKDWPFATIAKTAASMNPDLIIHVGDNLYRQEPCPKGDQGCEGSPYGDNWRTWEADFFQPASPLLKVAPWVIVRGNHETCSRAGLLWFEYMAPQKFTGECEEYSDPYLISFDNINFLNVDTAQASDFEDKPKEQEKYREWFGNLTALPENTWMVTHRPLWGVKVGEIEEDKTESISDETPKLEYANGTDPAQNLVGFNRTLQSSISQDLLDNLQLILSGHYHNFQTLNFDGVVPPQLIVGNSGTKLEKEIKESLNNLKIDGYTITDSAYLHQFGFVMLEEQADKSWKATEYDVDGKPVLVCEIKDRNISCTP